MNASTSAADDTERDPEREALGELAERVKPAEGAGLDHAGDGQCEHRAGRVVERRLGNERLLELLPDTEPVEQWDQDRRVCGSECRADQQCDRERHGEHRRRDERHDHRRQHEPRQHDEAEPDRGLGDHPERDTETPVEQDQRDAEGEHELGPEVLYRVVDPVGHRRPDEDARTEHHDHHGHAEHRGDRNRDEPCGEDQADVEQNVLRAHATEPTVSCGRRLGESGRTEVRRRRP